MPPTIVKPETNFVWPVSSSTSGAFATVMGIYIAEQVSFFRICTLSKTIKDQSLRFNNHLH